MSVIEDRRQFDGAMPTSVPADLGGEAAEAVIDRAVQRSGMRNVLLLVAGMTAVGIGIFALPPEWSSTAQLLVTAFLAVLGVLFLFSIAFEMIELNTRTAGDLFGRAFVEADESGILVTDRGGRIVYVNRAYADMTGAVKDRDVRTVERVMAGQPDAENAVFQLTRAAAEGGGGARDVRITRSLDGRKGSDAISWCRISCRSLALRGEGRRRVTVWRLTDITAERADQEREFRELTHAIDTLDRAPAGFVTSDRDGAITQMNATLAQWLGIDLARFRPGDLTLSDLRRGQGWSAVGEGGVLDCDLARPDGGTFAARLYAIEDDEASGISRTMVLDRAAIEGERGIEALRALRLFDASPMAIASVDADGAILESNAAFTAAFESGDERPTSLVQIDGEGAPLAAALARVVAGGKADPVEVTTADSEVIRVHLSASDTDGGGEAAILHALDVTEQRKLERELSHGRKMQSVGLLAGSIAHDFNNTLQGIIGFADLVLMSHGPGDRVHQDVTSIRDAADRSAALVKQLLAFSRKQTLRPTVLRIGDLLSDRMQLFKRVGGAIEVRPHHGRDLWPVRADAGKIEQVLMNLCVNARDAINEKNAETGRTPEGDYIAIRTSNLPAGEVRARIPHPDVKPIDYVMIEVADTGTGMSAEVMDRIFEPFFSTKASSGNGTGLGLSTVYGIVNQSGGFVHPVSELGEGTTFRVLLPRYEGTEEPEVVRPERPKRDLAGSATVLIVEDEDLVRIPGVRMLEKRGYVVHQAENGEDALEVLEDHGDEIDIIVSDVMMPEMDGPTLFRHVREARPDMPFIFASGHAEDAFSENLPEADAASFVFMSKPYPLEQLVTTVKETLERGV